MSNVNECPFCAGAGNVQGDPCKPCDRTGRVQEWPINKERRRKGIPPITQCEAPQTEEQRTIATLGSVQRVIEVLGRERERGVVLPAGMLADMLVAADLLSNRWKSRNAEVGRRLADYVAEIDAANHRHANAKPGPGETADTERHGSDVQKETPQALAIPPSNTPQASDMGKQPFAWATYCLDEPMLFLSREEALKYCDEGEEPIALMAIGKQQESEKQ